MVVVVACEGGDGGEVAVVLDLDWDLGVVEVGGVRVGRLWVVCVGVVGAVLGVWLLCGLLLAGEGVAHAIGGVGRVGRRVGHGGSRADKGRWGAGAGAGGE